MNNPKLTQLTPVRAGIAALALALSIVMSGCLAVATGASVGAAVAFKLGELDSTVPADLATTRQAAGKAITQLQFAKISEATDALNTMIVSRTARDEKVRIKLSKIGERTTRVEIRVGVFGNEATSLAVLDGIKATL